MWLIKAPPAAVPNMQNNDRISFDREQDTVLMWLVAVKKLAHIVRKLCIFRSKHTALWHLRE